MGAEQETCWRILDPISYDIKLDSTWVVAPMLPMYSYTTIIIICGIYLASYTILTIGTVKV